MTRRVSAPARPPSAAITEIYNAEIGDDADVMLEFFKYPRALGLTCGTTDPGRIDVCGVRLPNKETGSHAAGIAMAYHRSTPPTHVADRQPTTPN